MAQTSTLPGVRDHLDQLFPLVEHTEDPPGRSGRTAWRTRHGNSVVCWTHGRPVIVLDAMLADASHVDADNAGKDWRYRISDAPRRWVHGAVDIRQDGVTFTPGEQPKCSPPAPADHPDLEMDMANTAPLRARLVDDDFADALYAYLKNGDFFKEGGEYIWSIGLSGAADIVANLRGQGDVYTDYYPHGGRAPLDERARATRRMLREPELTPEEIIVEATLTGRFEEIKKILDGLGWRKPTTEDKLAAAAATRRDLASWEERPERPISDWATKIRDPATRYANAIRLVGPKSQTADEPVRDFEALLPRLFSLAKSGRISEAEYGSMNRRIALIP